MGGWGGGYFYGNTLENNQGECCLWGCCCGYPIYNNTFINNTGNAINLVETGSGWSVVGNEIINSGGIICEMGAVDYIKNNLITQSQGTAIKTSYFKEISNNIICNNTKGIFIEYSDNCGNTSLIINNIICNNNYGIEYYDCCSGTLKNNIISGNINYQVKIGQQVEWCDPDFITFLIYNNQIQGGIDNIVGSFIGDFKNNIDSDPLFINPTTGAGTSYDASLADWHLQGNSPCIDRGTFENAPRQDLDGKYRNGTVDIGAYEYNGITPSVNGFWLGSSNTSWNTAANWYNGSIPNSSTDVVVTAGGNQPVISSNSSCNDLTIHAQANVTVNDGSNFRLLYYHLLLYCCYAARYPNHPCLNLT
jgi:hypothetical protein